MCVCVRTNAKSLLNNTKKRVLIQVARQQNTRTEYIRIPEI